MRSLILVPILIWFSSCATAPKFQKFAGGSGYVVSEIDGPDHLKVDLDLPSGQTEKFYTDYGFRAVGEECKQRGFSFFNAAVSTLGHYEGFCAKAVPRILGITYTASGLNQNPPVFEIESVASKPKTYVLANDRVLEMDGRKLVRRADFMLASFIANKAGKSSQKLKIERASKILTVDEPMISVEHSYMDAADLQRLQGIIE